MQVLVQEFTNYHFDVKPNALHGALDRFAQFFIDPLCKADALEREVMAVDNEFSGTHSLGISGCFFAVSTCIVFSFSAKLMLPMDCRSSSCQSVAGAVAVNPLGTISVTHGPTMHFHNSTYQLLQE